MSSFRPDRPLSRAERRNRDKDAKAAWGKVLDRRAAVMDSGAGFHIDEELRDLLALYNSRVDENPGDPPLPFSFGVMGPFFAPRMDGPYASYEMAQERDHAYSASDFVDFVEAGHCDDAGRSRLRVLPQGVVHSFTAMGDIRGNAFIDSDGEAFATSGISFVRLGPKLHWMMIGGTVCDLGEQTEKLRASYRDIQANDGFQRLGNRQQDVDIAKFYAFPLEGVDNVWKTIAFGLFDLDRMTHESRTFARDEGLARTMISDDPGSVGIDDIAKATPQQTEGMQVFAGRLAEHAIVFDVAETMFQLPSYFAYKVTLVREVDRTTRAGARKGERAVRVVRAPPDARINIRRIETIEIVNAGAEGRTRNFTPPRFSQELDGFWRRLRPGRPGRDRDGNPEIGRTWVTGHRRWGDKPNRTGTITVKAPVTTALERAERLKAEGGVVSLTVDAD